MYRQLHGFSDASELAYAGVIYLHQVDTTGNIHTSLVASKTKVAPIKRLTIPRLELCGVFLLAQLLRHCQLVFGLPLQDVFAWSDSTIVLSWLTGNPRCFKTFVGNRISRTIDLVPSNRWHFVEGTRNPADCASRGLYPSELLQNELWWNGPNWLKQAMHHWPKQPSLNIQLTEEINLHASVQCPISYTIVPSNRYSTFTKLIRVTAYVKRFVNNTRTRPPQRSGDYLTSDELNTAITYRMIVSQHDHFSKETNSIKQNKSLHKSSYLRYLDPILDNDGLIRVG